LHGHDVHVVTRTNNQAVIDASITKSPVAGLTFHYLDLPGPFRFIKKRTGTVGLIIYYYVWQLALAFKARSLHRRLRFDLLHHVTFANDWLPSGLAFIADTPLVWGPVGGSSHRAPPDIEVRWPARDRRYERLRRLMQRLFLRFDPLLHLTRHRATIVLPYTEGARSGLPASARAKSRVVTHIGVDDVAPSPGAARRKRDRLEIVTGGRLVHWKGFDLLIEGLAHHLDQHPGTVHLTVTGSGPWKSRLVDAARHEGISDSVDFVGRLPSQGDVLAMVAEADLYALPTWRDGPPVAILEAMSVSTPVLCLDLGATAELVPATAGILIPPVDRAAMIRAIGEAVTWCYQHRSELIEMGSAAASRVADRHLWSSIGQVIDGIYRDIAEET
jgi:glycosyltransferase involved in cell wall biosynthesis